jgi:hypothetical protein
MASSKPLVSTSPLTKEFAAPRNQELPMNVTLEKTLPTSNAYHQETKPMTVTNDNSLQNDTVHGRTSIGKGEVVFRLSNFKEPVDITIDLLEGTHQGRVLETKSFDWDPKRGNIFVRFKGFPPRYTQHNTQCYYSLWLVPKNPNNGTTLDVQVLYLAS